ncbi:AraC family transcriptional regulator [Streptomyces sp. NPDC090106]|uniref:AraC family transcriptional regulator n=1 Tax=Streptomyces sp. NPDC090106 TaxID=3365946 RepID=UPI00380BA6A9
MSEYRTQSLDEARAAIASHYFDLRLDVVGEMGDFDTRLNVVTVGALTIGDITCGTRMLVGFDEPGVYQVVVPLIGGSRVQQGRGQLAYATTSSGAFMDTERRIFMDDWTDDFRTLTVKVDKLALWRQLEVLLGRPVIKDPDFSLTIDVSRGAGQSWVGLVRWVLLDHETPPGLLQQPVIAERLEQVLLEGLLRTADHGFRDALESPAPPMRSAALRRVVEAIREHPGQPLNANDLAAIGQVSLRTLQEAFRRELGMPPMRYLAEVRLQRAHDDLLAADPATDTVTEVAYRWGFAHLGRFGASYRKRFGETPSQTLRSP